jgi:hypothetical protein
VTDTQFVDVLSFGLSALLLLSVFALVREYRISSTRDQLFALRDELFFYAHEQRLLGSPAYKKLRLLINGGIQYAHNIYLFKLGALVLSKQLFGIKPEQSTTHVELQKLIDDLPDGQKEKLMQVRDHTLLIMIKHLVLGSPILCVIGLIIAGNLVIHHSAQALVNKTLKIMTSRAPLDLIEAEAVADLPPRKWQRVFN